MEDARRSLIADEEARKIRVVESAAEEVSSSIDLETMGGTTYSVVADENTTEGVQTTEVVGSGELNPPAC